MSLDAEIWPPARGLGRVAQEIAHEWDVVLGRRFPGARFSFTAPADGAVLKVRPVEDDEADHEPDALAFWNGKGAVRLLRQDASSRAMLIERALPGYDASSVDEDEAIAAALSVGQQLWRPVERPPFRLAGDEARRWLDNVRNTGHRFVPIAQRTFAGLAPRHTVVHGDLHHHNLLRHGHRWVAIDPKPLIAEPEFDVVTLLWNPIGSVPTRDSVERWLLAFGTIGLDGQRVRDWAIVRGTYLGLPLGADEDEASVRQLEVVRILLD